MTIPLAVLTETAKSRPAGYLEDCIGRGSVVNGDTLIIPDDVFLDLVMKYRPSITGQLTSVLQAGCRWIARGLQLASDQVEYQRSCVCAFCPSWDARAQRCLVCGCYWPKLNLPAESCPLGKW